MPGMTGPRKLTYYKKNGEPVVLPCDPWSMELYLRKGFSLEPPKQETKGFVCDVCGKEVKTKLALAGHKRSHKQVD